MVVVSKSGGYGIYNRESMHTTQVLILEIGNT